jgi:hypothetical protein
LVPRKSFSAISYWVFKNMFAKMYWLNAKLDSENESVNEPIPYFIIGDGKAFCCSREG